MFLKLMIAMSISIVGMSTGIEAGPDEMDIYARPMADDSAWIRDERALICNFHNMYQPCVIEMPDGAYPYRMWFFGWATADGNPDIPGCDAVYHARSRDLNHWEKMARRSSNFSLWHPRKRHKLKFELLCAVAPKAPLLPGEVPDEA